MQRAYINHSNKYIYLFADCKIVKGHTRALIIDLSRKRIYPIPLSYYELSNYFRNKNIREIENILADKTSRSRFYDFIQFLLKKNLATLVDDISLFPELENEWDHPSDVITSIIDVRFRYDYLSKAIHELSQLRCLYLQVRFYESVDLIVIKDLAKLIKGKCFKDVQVFIKYSNKISTVFFEKLFNEQRNLRFIIHSVPASIQLMNTVVVQSTHQLIDSCNSCGIIDKYALNIPNVQGYMGNQLFNSCLNRKISVDEDGYITNCPSMKLKYGSIGKVKLTEVVKRKDFRKVWSINKDMIDTCKDCEFRYICSDCRAYTKDGNLKGKPSRCGYDPYTGIWNNQIKSVEIV